jgi:hypothetical protein
MPCNRQALVVGRRSFCSRLDSQTDRMRRPTSVRQENSECRDYSGIGQAGVDRPKQCRDLELRRTVVEVAETGAAGELRRSPFVIGTLYVHKWATKRLDDPQTIVVTIAPPEPKLQA